MDTFETEIQKLTIGYPWTWHILQVLHKGYPDLTFGLFLHGREQSIVVRQSLSDEEVEYFRHIILGSKLTLETIQLQQGAYYPRG